MSLPEVVVGPDTVILGIETSCDETAAAVVMGGDDVVSSVVSSQIDVHAEFGGVVPEVASRAHLESINPVVRRAIDDAGIDEHRIDAIACTVGPGLIGALLVGVSSAKALRWPGTHRLSESTTLKPIFTQVFLKTRPWSFP